MPDIVAWDDVLRELQLGAREAESWLVVRENANSGWHATFGGVALEARVVDGWQQAWVVPAGSAGLVTLTFTPDTTYRRGLVGGAVAVTALLVLCLLPSRRRSRSIGLSSVTVPWPWVGGALLVCAGLAFGPWGMLVGSVGWVVAGASRRLTPWAPAIASGACVAVAAVVLASGPWAAFDPYLGNAALPQLLVAAAVGGAVAAGGSGREALAALGTRRRSR